MSKSTIETPIWGLKDIAKLWGRHQVTLLRWIKMDAPESAVIRKDGRGQYYAFESEIMSFLKG